MSVDSLAELIRRAFDARILDLHTSLPGQVVVYNPITQKAKIQPVINRVIETEDNPLLQYLYEVLPILHDIPIAFPRGGGYSITWPLIPGDSVLVIFSESDISQWLVSGTLSNPDNLRRHGLSGGIALPCVGPDTAPLVDAVSTSLTLTGPDIRLGSMAAVSPVALATLVQAVIDIITAAYDSHTHTTPMGDSGPPKISIGSLGPVAALKVKAE